MENNKSQAEIYREERKERLAKAAAKQAKKSPKLSKSKRVAVKVIAIVLAVVVALGALGGILNFFGVPHKALKLSIGDSEYKYSIAEYNYYYYNIWYSYQTAAYQYETQYGEGMGTSLLGYDYTKAPASQEYTDDLSKITGLSLEDLGNPDNPTWADAFEYAAISQILQVKYGVEKANEIGLTLTEEEQKEIDDSIEEARKSAATNDYSLSRWFHTQIGKGLSEKIIYTIQTETALATAYYEKIQSDTLAAVTEEQINAEYNENRDDYDIVSGRMYTLSAVKSTVPDDATAEEKEAIDAADAEKTKKAADEFLANVTDEKSFVSEAQKAILSADNESTVKAEDSTKAEDVNYATIANSNEELAKWVYDDARKAGDKTAVKNDDGSYTIVYLTVLPHKDTSVSSSDVRHILVKFETKTDDDGNTVALTDAEKAKYKAEAEAILAEYKKDPTEENFAALAKEKTDDTASAESGGLFENVADDGQYVEQFTNWAIDESRKPGDTGIIETTFGYHVMYYVEANDDAWYETVKNAIFTEKYAEVTSDVTLEILKSVKLDSAILDWGTENQSKFIGRIVAQNY